LTLRRLQTKILLENQPHLPKNEEGSDSEQVQYRPSKELLRIEKFFSLLKFENRGKLEDLDLPGLSI
jgi:hypothetical protein